MRALNRFLASRRIASNLTYSEVCPSCASANTEPMFQGNDLSIWLTIDRRLKASDYRLCADCALLFAARRQKPAVASAYYDLFAEIEGRGYAHYPPPAKYLKGKRALGDLLCQQMRDCGLLRPGMRILHIRCDSGGLLSALREAVPDASLCGLDYFDSNIRFLREQDFSDVARLHPDRLEISIGGKFDLVIANHVFTHSLDPAADARVIRAAIADDGSVFSYNEVDHTLLFDPESEYFSRGDVNNYHKQLFTVASFKSFLARYGFASSLLERRKFTMTVLAQPAEATCDSAAEAADELRRLVPTWYPDVVRYRKHLYARRQFPHIAPRLKPVRKTFAKVMRRIKPARVI